MCLAALQIFQTSAPDFPSLRPAWSIVLILAIVLSSRTRLQASRQDSTKFLGAFGKAWAVTMLLLLRADEATTACVDGEYKVGSGCEWCPLGTYSFGGGGPYVPCPTRVADNRSSLQFAAFAVRDVLALRAIAVIALALRAISLRADCCV
jgi:hypothetical protein